MMLPTDMALIEDAAFKPWVEKYAADKVSSLFPSYLSFYSITWC